MIAGESCRARMTGWQFASLQRCVHRHNLKRYSSSDNHTSLRGTENPGRFGLADPTLTVAFLLVSHARNHRR
jgi:hypothetical protein